MFKFLIYILIFIYPVISFLPRDLNGINKIWGGITFIIVGAYLVNKYTQYSSLKINTFIKSAFAIALVTSLVILVNEEASLTKFLNILKYLNPLLLATFFEIEFRKNSIKVIKKITWLYLLFGLVFIVYRAATINFNLTEVMANREHVWFSKSYGIAISYFSMLIFYFSILIFEQKEFRWFHLLLFTPIFYFGSRTILISGIVFSVIIFYKEIISRNIFTYLVSFLSIMFLSIYIINYQRESFYSVSEKLVISEKNAKEEQSDIDAENFSSGRTLILNYYINTISFRNTLLGNGMAYYNKNTFGYRLHNDILEFFFSFGIFGVVVFLKYIYNDLFIKPWRRLITQRARYFVFATFLFFFISGMLTSVLDYQIIMYIYFALIILAKHNSQIHYILYKNKSTKIESELNIV